MGFSSFRRLLTRSTFSSRKSSPSVLSFSTSAIADQIFAHLRTNPNNPETVLHSLKPNIDPLIVNELLKQFSTENHLLGLRFFVWAGNQPQYKHSLYMYSKAIDLLGVAKNPLVVRDLLESYSGLNRSIGAKMFDVILTLCKECKLPNEALFVLRKMPEHNVYPNTNAYSIVISLFCDAIDMGTAQNLFDEMATHQLYPNMVTYVSMIKGFCNARRPEDACATLRSMRANGCIPNVVVYSTLLDGVAKFGNAEKARELLTEMENEGGNCAPNVITYTSMIQILCKKGEIQDALKVLDKMRAHGCRPNRVTLSVLIEALCSNGRVKEAEGLIEGISGEDDGVSLGECYSSLVLCMVRLKKREEAVGFFRKCLLNGVKLDGVSCSVLMKEYCAQKEFLSGFKLLVEIEDSGWLTTVDSDIYPALLLGLYEGNFKEEALIVGRYMKEKGIVIKGDHCSRIVQTVKNFGDFEALQH